MFKPIVKDIPHLLHGGDYNPDQWLSMPEIIKEDVRLMKLANINCVSIGIFSWKALEPKEGVYTFEWLDELMDRLDGNGIGAFLATPSGARPAWMDSAHEEVLRVETNRIRNLHGGRHNHCYTSPYYRQKVREMNTLLATRYKDHKALKLWHISNEYGGECHCLLCQEAFRSWLEEKYHNDIHELNSQWWTRFWSHEFSSFEEIESPSLHGEKGIHGLNLDWKRFVTYQTNNFMENEMVPLREITPNVPVTTNFMGTYSGYDAWVLGKTVDVISWDSYPNWHNDYESVADTAASAAFIHDINRSFKKQPFLLMESTPSQVNWQSTNKLKRPGMHELSSMQAVAHGADSVQYFQWRKSRGASEKFHGAVIDHYGKEDTRVFREVATLGKHLTELDELVGTYPKTEVALLFDWDNRWAIENMQGLNKRVDYEGTCKNHYRPFWNMGLSVDVNEMKESFEGYKLVVAPMLYMLKPGVANRLKNFVKAGGSLILTYVTGYVNENDLCFLGGFPGDGLIDVSGIWAEEIDPLFPSDRNAVVMNKPFANGKECYECFDLCEIIHAKEGTEVLATYDSDFYQGTPAVTKHTYGKGTCYYIATRTEQVFLTDFYQSLVTELGILGPPIEKIPDGISITHRNSEDAAYYFIMNFSEKVQTVKLLRNGVDVFTGKTVNSDIEVGRNDYRIIKM